MTQQVTGTVTLTLPFVPTPSTPPVLPTPQYVMCFLCMRQKKGYIQAHCVYRGTYLCGTCVQDLPEEMIINEFPG